MVASAVVMLAHGYEQPSLCGYLSDKIEGILFAWPVSQ
jgi:hypothetical protein